jgi:predicted nucleic acid-binding protein
METFGLGMLLDTHVLIECLRGSPTAAAWLASLKLDEFEVPGVVAMELLMGCRNAQELRQTQKFLDAFHVVWPNAWEFEKAYQMLVSLRLSTGLGIPDCLIAAMALARGVRLYTFNLKHFQNVPGLDVQRPYVR